LKKQERINVNTLLQINTVGNYGSTGRIVEEIGILATGKGWNSYIAFGRNERPSKSKVIKIGSALDRLHHGLSTRLFDRHGFASVRATKQLIRKIAEIKPDIIHLHNLHGYYLNIRILFEYLATIDIPLIWTLHDCWAMTGHCTHFEPINCLKWMIECHNCPLKKKYPASYFLDRSKRNYYDKKELFTSLKRLTIVPVSIWLSDILKASYLSKYPYTVINNGINIDIFKPTPCGDIRIKYNLDNKFVILGVATDWVRSKGLADFIELSRKLDSGYQIILVGLSQNQIKQIPKNIIGITRTENLQEITELYSCAEIFLNPTYQDSFPTTNLEAMACGTPVITYNTGGSTESIIPETGIIVQKGDITGLINAIEIVRERGKSYYSLKCIERARLFYNRNDRYAEYLKLYDKIHNE
jgi:putative colanic acid biosynthesis glycosyltransferase